MVLTNRHLIGETCRKSNKTARERGEQQHTQETTEHETEKHDKSLEFFFQGVKLSKSYAGKIGSVVQCMREVKEGQTRKLTSWNAKMMGFLKGGPGDVCVKGGEISHHLPHCFDTIP